MFGNGKKEEESEGDSDRLEVKEVNKIIGKVVKKQKKVSRHAYNSGNVDDLVSEEDEPSKKRKAKELQKRQKASQPKYVEEDHEKFGGFKDEEKESEIIKDKQAEIDRKQKSKEDWELRRQKRKEKLEIELQQKNDAINHNMNRTIMKGKGLYRKRPKKYRNPRVKHKLKYKDALTKRRRLVQEYKTGPQPKYTGELTGIRSNLIRSEKM